MKLTMLLIVLVLFVDFFAAKVFAFGEDYMSPQDIVLSLDQKFAGLSFLTTDRNIGCRAVEVIYPNDNDRQVLGDTNPQTGVNTVSEPGAAFIDWINGCVDTYMDSMSQGYYLKAQDSGPSLYAAAQADDKIWETQLIGDLYKPFLAQIVAGSNSSDSFPEMYFLLQKGDQILATAGAREALVKNLVEWVLGSDDEIYSYGRITSADAFRKDLVQGIANETSLDMATRKVLKTLFMRDEFLMY